MLGVHTWLTFVWAPWVVRCPARAAKALRRFARAELGSKHTMTWAAAATRDVEVRAAYLRHAADEGRHARLFHRRAAVLDGRDEPLRADAEDLLANLGERRFLVFVHRAEKRGQSELGAYARAFRKAGDVDTAKIFDGVLSDEARHVAYTKELLVGENVGAMGIVFWEGWRASRRFGRSVAELCWLLLMSLLYPLLAPLALWQRLRDRAS